MHTKKQRWRGLPISNKVILNNENILITANDEKNHVMLELSTSGYRPRIVSVYLSTEQEIDTIIEALTAAKQALKK